MLARRTYREIEKDRRRINDIIRKAAGDKEKEAKLAYTMALLITNVEKAQGRAAVARTLHKDHIAAVFDARVEILNMMA